MKTEIDNCELIKALILDLRNLGLSDSEIKDIFKELSLLNEEDETSKSK